jgi:hypothetical protein
MKLSHFASAAATVLALSSAAPAFAQTGFIAGYWGENRDKTTLQNTEQHGAQGAVSFPLGGVEVSVEASYNDTGRDPLEITVATNNGTVNFPEQTLFAGSVYTRNDKFGYGATVAGGTIGEIAIRRADNASTTSFHIDDITIIEASGVVQTYQDKWVGSARIGLGRIDIGNGVLELLDNPSFSGPYENRTNEKNYLNIDLEGDFFFTDNAVFVIAVNYKDMEHDDPVFSNHLGIEWRAKERPIGLRTDIEFSKFGNSVTVGVVGNFGAETLNDRVRKGPLAPWTGNLRNYSHQFVEGKL